MAAPSANAASKIDDAQQGSSKNSTGALLRATLSLTPIALLSLLVVVLSYYAQISIQANSGYPVREERSLIIHSHNSQSVASPALPVLLQLVAEELEEANVSYWLLPGLGLLPSTDVSNQERIDGKLSPWQEGVDIGVFQSDLLSVIHVQSALQSKGVVATESYYGLRLYSIAGRADDRYDFQTPFIDIVYFDKDSNQIISNCCDCGPVTVSACTKKTCGCTICAHNHDDIFPLSSIRIEGIRKALNGPRRKETLMLPLDLEGIHPALVNLHANLLRS